MTYVRTTLGAVVPGSIVQDAMARFAAAQINPGGPPSAGGLGIRGWIDLLHQAEAAGDIPSVLGIQNFLLPFTPEGPAEHETDYFNGGSTPAEVLREYVAAGKWVSARPAEFNEQLGPGYSHATELPGGDAPITGDEARAATDAAAAAVQAAHDAANTKRRADFVKEFQGLGYDAATIAAELARLDALFENDWATVDGSPWNYVGAQFIDSATGSIKRASSSAPPAAPPDLKRGRYIINGRVIVDGVDMGPAPSVTGGAGYDPTGGADPGEATNGAPGTEEAGIGGKGLLGLAIAGGILIAGALASSSGRPKGYTDNRRRR